MMDRNLISMKDSQKFTPNPDFTIENFDNEVLLYSIPDSTGIYLNETACVVWELCRKSQSVGEIITLLETTYPAQRAAVRKDVVRAITSLVEKGVLMAANG
ncbi:MAG: hypothetical protein DSY90_01975 [Deltaproteobacteria bacterium]|nr:MAG: hypothetical protein DSY90_01975 [Deltaproteobacteria bacterium]